MMRPCGKPAETPKLTLSCGAEPIRIMSVGQLVGLLELQPENDCSSKKLLAREKLKRTWLIKALLKFRTQSRPICWLSPGTLCQSPTWIPLPKFTPPENAFWLT